MGKAIGIRLDSETLKKVKELEEEESLDRSTIIRKLVLIGYKNLATKKAAQNYIEGKITISEAAHKAGISIWDMEKCIVDSGFRSSYSIEDLRNELNI